MPNMNQQSRKPGWRTINEVIADELKSKVCYWRLFVRKSLSYLQERRTNMAEPKFKVGDRVEVDLCANTSQTARWARTTITSVHTPKTDPISGIIYRTTKGTYQEKDVRAPQEEGNG